MQNEVVQVKELLGNYLYNKNYKNPFGLVRAVVHLTNRRVKAFFTQ